MTIDKAMAVGRALKILDAFSAGDANLSLAELADFTGFHKSTILRLCNSLMEYDYLGRDERGGFHLGSALWRLGMLYQKNFNLGAIVEPALRRLRDSLNESASFYIREGDKRICLYRLNSKRDLRHEIEQFSSLPLGMGASGKVLLKTKKTDFQLQKYGYILSLGERDPDIGSMAVPVIGPGATLRGALSVSGLVTHFLDKSFEKRIADLLMEEAVAIGRDLIE